jgi:hypothetical protein
MLIVVEVSVLLALLVKDVNKMSAIVPKMTSSSSASKVRARNLIVRMDATIRTRPMLTAVGSGALLALTASVAQLIEIVPRVHVSVASVLTQTVPMRH